MNNDIEEILENLKDNIPLEEYRSEGTSDGLTHYEEDKESWQYKLLDYITNLQEENKKLKEWYCNRTDCSGRIKDSKKYESVQQKLDKIMKYCTSNIQIYDDGDGQYQGEDCCIDGFEIINIIESEE